MAGNTHWPHHSVCLLKFPLPALLLHMVIPFLLPEKAERDIFNDFVLLLVRIVQHTQHQSTYISNIHQILV